MSNQYVWINTFIDLVRPQEFLYNSEHDNYKIYELRQNAWEEILTKLNNPEQKLN